MFSDKCILQLVFKAECLDLNMKNKTKTGMLVLIAVIVIVGIILINFYPNGEDDANGENETEIIIYNGLTGVPDPSSGYCHALGYDSKKGVGEGGGQVGICIFPDKSECEQWAFYRGKCGQEWSYCKLKEYDLKNLSETEGWLNDGSVCIDKNTKEEIGNVYDLVNQEWLAQQKEK